MLRAGDKAGGFGAYRESLEINRKLVARNPGDAKAQNDLASLLRNIGNAKSGAGDNAGALAAYQEYLGVARRLAEDKRDNKAQSILADALGCNAYAELLIKDYAKALVLSDEAIALAPDELWLQTNHAHALMLLGRRDEARAIYLKYRGKMIHSSTLWEQAVKGDFAALRKAGISDPLMNKIEADFAKPNLPIRSK
jgi:tetratricopeptide (TPR) repeat protein